jgi:hypothetical protein
MILFGLAALWAIQKDRPFLAGLFAMLSALIWQPGLLFLGAAGLAFSRYLTSWRDLKVLMLLSGALVPLVLQVLHLWLAGGLRDFYLWTIDYNFTVYAPGEVKSFAEFIDYLLRMLRGPFRQDRIYFLLAVIGATLVFFREVKRVYDLGAREVLEGASRHSLIIAPVVYFAFCSVNVQGSADMLPFVPFIAIFSSVALIALLDGAGYLLARKRAAVNRVTVANAGFAAACLLVPFLSVADAFIYRGTPITLQQQEADVREMTSLVGPGEKVFTHGRTEILVISGLTNASKYFFLDRDKDVYLDQVEPGGFYGWFERLKADRPKVVALGRLRKVRHRNDFKEWVSRDYEMRQGKVFQYYVRKD